MRARGLALLGALAVGITACGGDDGDGGGAGAGGQATPKTVTIYSSLALQGASRAQSAAMVNGMELALEQAGGKAGDIPVKYESLDDSTAQVGAWTPEATTTASKPSLASSVFETGVFRRRFTCPASIRPL